MNMQRPWLKLFTALLAVHVAAVSKKNQRYALLQHFIRTK